MSIYEGAQAHADVESISACPWSSSDPECVDVFFGTIV